MGLVYKTDSVVLRITTSSIETECVYGIYHLLHLIPFEWEYGLTHETYLEEFR